jgi:hypothetical protein
MSSSKVDCMLLPSKGEGEFLPYLWRGQFGNETEQTPGQNTALFATALVDKMNHEDR